MVRAVTEAFHEMVLEVDMTVPVVVTSLSSANPAVVTVGAADIAKFTNGMVVLISGALGTLSAANGDHAISISQSHAPISSSRRSSRTPCGCQATRS